MGALSKRTKWGDVESLHNTDDESDCKRVIGFASKRMKQDYLDEENSVPEEDDTSEDEMKDEDEDESDGSDAGQNGRRIDEEMDELEKQYQNLRSEEQNLLKNLKRQKDEDVVKGQAVKNQKVLWDKTLELRFLLQKAFSSSNKLPQEPVKSLFCSSAQNVDQAYSDLIFSARQTLNSILELQEVLLENPSILQDSIENYKDDTLNNLEEDNDKEWLQISNMHSRIIPFRNSSIDKWHRKTQVISGVAAFRGKLQALNQNISEQVAGYMRDPSRMIRRMQLSGSSVGVLGKIPKVSETETLKKEGNVADGNVDGDPELLDDSEFYLQLLKEFLESNLSSSETAYYALRKLQPKKRKVVDRRASKNRKIRYHVHEKIANFMAPVPMVLPSMAPKLFENLFGLNKEKSNSGI